jgi:hypothetical protein
MLLKHVRDAQTAAARADRNSARNRLEESPMADPRNHLPGPGRSPDSTDRRPRLRVAVVATPRSGNTWLRSLLGSLYGLTNVVCDRPEEVPWDELPERCVLQLHWNPEPELLDSLRRHGFHAVTIARHPLDVLISILHFCTTWPGTSRWFGGRSGSEDSICGALPGSDEFRKYASGPRAQALLSVTRDWWRVADCQKLRYEALVADPRAELERLARTLEPAALRAISDAVEENSFERLKPRVQNQHYWRGTPAHWRRFIPAPVARQLALVHASSFELLKYQCEPDDTLTSAQADLYWLSLEILSLRQELSTARTQFLEETGAQLEPIRDLGPRAIWVAQRLHGVAATCRALYASLARCLRPFARRAA